MRRGEPLLFLGREFDANFIGNGESQLALQGEQVAELALVALGPQLGVGAGIKQASCDLDSIARPLYGAFDNSVNIELACNFLERLRFLLVTHYRGPRDDTAQTANLA